MPRRKSGIYGSTMRVLQAPTSYPEKIDERAGQDSKVRPIGTDQSIPTNRYDRAAPKRCTSSAECRICQHRVSGYVRQRGVDGRPPTAVPPSWAWSPWSDARSFGALRHPSVGLASFVPSRRPGPTTVPQPVLACGAALATRFSEQAGQCLLLLATTLLQLV